MKMDGRRFNGRNQAKVRKPGLLQEYIDAFNLMQDFDKVAEHFGVVRNAVVLMFKRRGVEVVRLARLKEPK